MGDPEVSDFRHAVLREEHVGRLDIAVDHALAMRVVQRIEDLTHQAHRIGGLEALAGLEVVP